MQYLMSYLHWMFYQILFHVVLATIRNTANVCNLSQASKATAELSRTSEAPLKFTAGLLFVKVAFQDGGYLKQHSRDGYSRKDHTILQYCPRWRVG